jgi:hypothetical protein
MNDSEKRFVEESDDPGFYSWLINDMGAVIKPAHFNNAPKSKPKTYHKGTLFMKIKRSK